jgi:microcystin-dependent protein
MSIDITTDGTTLFINKSISTESVNVSDNYYINHQTSTPVGSILSYAGITAPNGWLLCDGSEINKTTYSNLYSVVGTLYGASVNPNNFKLPNLVNRIPVGKGNTNSIGDIGGNDKITLSVNQVPSHTHTGSTVNSVSHTHTGTTNNNGTHNHSINDPGHSHSQWTVNDDFNNSGGNPPSFTGDSAGSRTWYNINASTTGISINNSGDHNHTFTTNADGIHNHTFTTDATGSGSEIDVRNKYIVLNYIIRY